MNKTDICIVGAGPAGAMAALFLAKAGISCVLLDKESFPRDKICGDGISGWVLDVLEELDANLLLELASKEFLLHSNGLRVGAPNGKFVDLPFEGRRVNGHKLPAGFIAKRKDFDNYLIEEVRKKNEIDFIEGVKIESFISDAEHVILEDKDKSHRFKAKLVIFANGARSSFMKVPGGISKSDKNKMIGVKAYYDGVRGCHPDNHIELHFIKGLIPGYFWIFPLPDGQANVGVGLDQYRIRKRKLNLTKVMMDAIEHNPSISERFEKAKRITSVQAYGLPLWDKMRSISGERYMLCGDTASLIDPFTGEGVGHAVLSGMCAAKQAVQCLKQDRYDAAFMHHYDKALYNRIGKELKISKNILRFLQFPGLFNLVMNKTVKSEYLQDHLSRALTDLDVRKKLKNPVSYLRGLL